ncbi:MAG: hypothetical protein NTZ61_00525, partial [Proteobacteria bacterium]|nr:hypothetical protein [Pseudomonadota bacterium]
FPEVGFKGSSTFTFAANDGKTDSNLGSARVIVQPPGSQACGLGAELAIVLLAMRARRRSLRLASCS